MIPRGSLTKVTILLLVTGAALSNFGGIGGASTTPVSDNAKTLFVSVPGPFNGCSFLDSGATPTSNAVLDLLRPSAFQTTTSGNLVGEGGPIAAAELTSLQPETIVYTISAHQHWSSGLSFNGTDLIDWWQRARTKASIQSDGYRSIKSMTLSGDGLSVTAVFAAPYADWNQLFRDVDARGTTAGCAITNLMRRPSLGPYLVKSATASRVVLAMNPKWPLDANRYGRVVLTTGGEIPAKSSTPFANYTLQVDRAQAQSIGAHPTILSHIGTSSEVVILSFAPKGPLTSARILRQALSWSLDRQALINKLWGSVTFSPSVAVSALYAQGENAYPGVSGPGPSTQPAKTTTTLPGLVTTPPGLSDCLACAYQALKSAGYHRKGGRWLDVHQVPLVIHMAIGPSSIDRATSVQVRRQWANAGIGTIVTSAASDASAAVKSATNGVDVALFVKPILTSPSFAARSWSGTPFLDSYGSGFRSATINALFNQAISNFNPVAATTTWLLLDQAVMKSYWVRPLFTAPSIVEWGNAVSGVTGSLSIPGFLDQVTSWNTAPPITN